jgi:hypothetical protein
MANQGADSPLLASQRGPNLWQPGGWEVSRKRVEVALGGPSEEVRAGEIRIHEQAP